MQTVEVGDRDFANTFVDFLQDASRDLPNGTLLLVPGMCVAM